MYIMNALSIKNKTHPHEKKQQPSTSGDQHHKPDNIIKHCYCISKHHLPYSQYKMWKVTQTFFFSSNTHTSHKMLLWLRIHFFLNFILLSSYTIYNFIMASTHFYVPGLWHHHLYQKNI